MCVGSPISHFLRPAYHLPPFCLSSLNIHPFIHSFSCAFNKYCVAGTALEIDIGKVQGLSSRPLWSTGEAEVIEAGEGSRSSEAPRPTETAALGSNSPEELVFELGLQNE